MARYFDAFLGGCISADMASGSAINTGDITLGCYINVGFTGDFGTSRIIRIVNSGGSTVHQFRFSSSPADSYFFGVQYSTTSANTVTVGDAVELGVDLCVVCTHNATDKKSRIWIGSPVGAGAMAQPTYNTQPTGSGTRTTGGTGLRFGASDTAGTDAYEGVLSNVFYTNRLVPPSEMELYRLGNMSSLFDSSLRFFFPLDSPNVLINEDITSKVPWGVVDGDVDAIEGLGTLFGTPPIIVRSLTSTAIDITSSDTRPAATEAVSALTASVSSSDVRPAASENRSISTAAVFGNPLQTTGSTDNQTSYNTQTESGSAVTPSADALQLLLVQSANGVYPPETAIPTTTGCSLTWVRIGTVMEALNNIHRTTLFRSMGASPTTGGLTIDFAGETQAYCAWSLVEFTGVKISGANGEDAVAQVVGFSLNSIIHEADLGTFLDAGDATYAGFGSGQSRTITPGSGFTELGEYTVASPDTFTVQTEWKAAPDTTADVTANTTTIGVIFGVEIVQVGVTTIPKIDVDDGSFEENQTITSGGSALLISTDRIGAQEAHSLLYATSSNDTLDEVFEDVAEILAETTADDPRPAAVEDETILRNFFIESSDSGTATFTNAPGVAINDISAAGGAVWDSPSAVWDSIAIAWDSFAGVGVGGDAGFGTEAQSIDSGVRSSSDTRPVAVEAEAPAATISSSDQYTDPVYELESIEYTANIVHDDTGTGAEGQSVAAANSSTDVGVGAEDQSLSIQYFITSTDTGSGAEAVAPTAAQLAADTGSGAETQIPGPTSAEVVSRVEAQVVAFTRADTGTSAEAFAIGVSSSEVVTRTETHALNATTSAADTGTRAEAQVIGAGGFSDSGSSAEAHFPAMSIVIIEVGTATFSHAISVVPPIPVSSSDVGVGAEAVAPAAAVSRADTGTSVDAVGLSGPQSADTGTSSEAVIDIDEAFGIDSVDTGTCAEVITAMTATLTSTELITVTEAANVAIPPQADVGTSSESQIISITVTDTGSFTDVSAPQAGPTAFDFGSGAEAEVSYEAAMASTDTATDTESFAAGTATMSSADTGVRAETQTVSPRASDPRPAAVENQTIQVNGTELITVTELGTPRAALSRADTGSSTDARVTSAFVVAVETAFGLDQVVTVGQDKDGDDQGFFDDIGLVDDIDLPVFDTISSVEAQTVTVSQTAHEPITVTEDAEYETPYSSADSGTFLDEYFLGPDGGDDAIDSEESESKTATVGRALQKQMHPRKPLHSVEPMYPVRR